MAGAREVAFGWVVGWSSGLQDGAGTIGGRDSCSHSFPGIDGLCEGGAEDGRVVMGHQGQAERVAALAGQSETGSGRVRKVAMKLMISGVTFLWRRW